MQDWKQGNAASTEMEHIWLETRFDIEQDVATLAGSGVAVWGHGHS